MKIQLLFFVFIIIFVKSNAGIEISLGNSFEEFLKLANEFFHRQEKIDSEKKNLDDEASMLKYLTVLFIIILCIFAILLIIFCIFAVFGCFYYQNSKKRHIDNATNPISVNSSKQANPQAENPSTNSVSKNEVDILNKNRQPKTNIVYATRSFDFYKLKTVYNNSMV